MSLAKLYTIVVGGLFLVAVGATLMIELVGAGFTLEAGHKAVHVALGVWAATIVWQGSESQYRAFAWTNGLLWGAVATFGWLMPDYHDLAAFNRIDTILHSLVAIGGLGAAMLSERLPLRA